MTRKAQAKARRLWWSWFTFAMIATAAFMARPDWLDDETGYIGVVSLFLVFPSLAALIWGEMVAFWNDMKRLGPTRSPAARTDDTCCPLLVSDERQAMDNLALNLAPYMAPQAMALGGMDAITLAAVADQLAKAGQASTITAVDLVEADTGADGSIASIEIWFEGKIIHHERL
jgi:hypothetical protein